MVFKMSKTFANLIQKAENGDFAALLKLQRMPLTKEESWTLATSKSQAVRANHCHRPDLPLKEVKLLCQDFLPYVRRQMVYNPLLPKTQLNQFSRDPDLSVLYSLISSRPLSLSLQKYFVNHSDFSVRECLAKKKDLDLKIISRLLKDPQDHVRYIAWETFWLSDLFPAKSAMG